MGDLTANFSLSEFIVSDSYPELAAKIELSALDKYKAFWMATTFLQPLRDILPGLQIVIKSGKRSEELNDKVGGVDSSDHLWRRTSCAVDYKLRKSGSRAGEWEPIGKYWNVIYNFCWRRRWAVNQLIWYYPNTGNFIHHSLADGGKSWDVKYCVARGQRMYFSSQLEANNYLRSAGGG